MYPVKLGYSEAVKRVRALLKNGHHAEALLTAVFTVEKTLYRTLRQLVVSAGFPSKEADTLMQRFKGIENIKQVWACFDPKLEPLSKFVKPRTLKTIADAQTMRNKMVHGSAVYAMQNCKETAIEVLDALNDLKNELQSRYNFSGWTIMRKRSKSTLHSDARVKL